jgi:NADH-quinone oxidoreductase subunit A
MEQDFLTILIFMLFGGAFVLVNMVAIGRLLRSKTDYTEQKSTPYECGEPTFGSAFVRFDIRFYVLALVFIIFDVEVLFLFPWAVVLKELGPLALIEAAVFVLVLAVGLAYVWRKGDVDWIPLHGHKKPGARLGTEDLTAAATPPAREHVGAGAEG